MLLNTDFGPHQLGEVLKREGVGVAVFDDEFAPTFSMAGFEGSSFPETQIREASITEDHASPVPPQGPGRIVIMTSGTTGLPKGAQRATLTPPVEVVVSTFPASIAGTGAGGRLAATLPLVGIRLHGIRPGPPGHPRRAKQIRP